MKTLKIYLCMLVIALGAVACSDDNDETPIVDLISGTFSGYTSAAFSYSSTPIVTEDETVTISGDASSVELTYTSETWGTATFSDVTVTATTSGYTLSGSGTATMSSHSGGTSTYDCTLSGTISSDKSTVDLTFTYPSVMGGTVITFTMGDAPTSLLIAGTYSGYTSAAFAYATTPIITEDETVTIAAEDDGSITLTYTSGTWGTATFTGITVAEDETTGYTLSGSGTAEMSSHSGGTS
ncbi:MAG: calycin-like domain-containing protein, partial [Bacteroides sp.]|nr:calycin-like domain-containing protein [Bacteroides sp.]